MMIQKCSHRILPRMEAFFSKDIDVITHFMYVQHTYDIYTAYIGHIIIYISYHTTHCILCIYALYISRSMLYDIIWYYIILYDIILQYMMLYYIYYTTL